MATLGIELNDVGFLAAVVTGSEVQSLQASERPGATDWPGFAYHDGKKFIFGGSAEDMWFVHPRSVTNTFWSKLAHDPAGLQGASFSGKPPSTSQLAFYFFQEFLQQISRRSGPYDKVVLAVPGGYLKDAATEEEKIGLLLGMAGELKLPLAGVIDLACASLCDPRAGGFSSALPVVVVDIQLHGAELSFFSVEDRLVRKRFLQLPQFGFAQLLKHVNAAMGNRFLRHTAFDILEDGRIEQSFFRQTKEFLLSGAPEYRFQINTAKRNYELIAKQEKLVSDAHPVVSGLVQAVQAFLRDDHGTVEPCTVALSARVDCLPGVGDLLRAAGFHRLLHLPAAAGASGAAKVGEARLNVPTDLADVAVETSVPMSDARRAVGAPWEARLIKARGGARPAPTHAIFEGIGHTLGNNGHFSVGAANAAANLALPEAFNVAKDCVVLLAREDGKLWFEEGPLDRTSVNAGDRLAIRCGALAAEVLFVHCAS